MKSNSSLLSTLLFLFLSVPLCLGGSNLLAAEKTLLLIGQKPDGHPPGTHEYLPAQRIVQALLKEVPSLRTEIVQADEPWTEGPDLLAKADGVFLFVSEGAKWLSTDPRRYEAFTRLAQRRGGLAAVHWATGTKDAANVEPYVKLLGCSHGGPDRKYTFFEEIELTFEKNHPATAGLGRLTLGEEFYFRLKRAGSAAGRLTPLATIPADGEREMVAWAFDRTDGGRSFGFTGLHFHKNWSRPEYRRFVAQGILWTLALSPPEGAKFEVPAEVLELGK